MVGNYIGGFAILAEVVTVWWLPFYFRSTEKLKKTAHYFALSYSIMMAIITFSSGGSNYSANPWWAICPVFMTLIVGEKAGRIWLFVALGALTLAFGAELLNISIPNLISQAPEDEEWRHLLVWFHYFGCVLLLALTAKTFDFINDRAFIHAHASLKQAREASQEAKNINAYLHESVDRILIEMQDLASGDLTAQLEILDEDEIGRLCTGFNRAVGHMHDAVQEVTEAVEVTVGSSEQIASAAGQLSRSAERQKDEVLEISVSVKDLVNSISTNAKGARHSSEAARDNGNIAREGSRVVGETVRKIEEIAEVVNQSARAISKLAVSSTEIGAIVSVIQDIANKTNLLALNATIEAAHAGEAGKGFGVIAEEVKDLAYQTAQATEQITRMIQNVQEETQGVISNMEVGSEQVQQGKSLAGQAGSALNQILDSSENLTELVQDIAISCEEQSQQSEFFFQRIETMKQLTNESVVDIKNISSSANKLEQLTERLSLKLSHFKV